MAFGSSVLTHKKEQQIKIEGEFKSTVDCLCATRRRFVFIHKGIDALTRAGYSASMMQIYQDNGYASKRFQRVHRHDLWQGFALLRAKLLLNERFN